MDNAKKRKIVIVYIALLFVIFPFGQLLRYEFYFNQVRLVFLPLDILVSLSIYFVYYLRLKSTPIDKIIKDIFYVLVFSLIFSFSLFNLEQIVVGTFYLFRLLAYYFAFRLLWIFNQYNKENRNLINNYLKSALCFTGIFGWIQYFIYPDLRTFSVWGWDDHLYRLVGTFLDPAFMGIMMVFGLLICFNDWLIKKRKYDLVISVFFLLTLAFTYSRASYLALVGGVFVLFYYKKYIKRFILFFALFIFIILLLPRPDGSGVQLERVFSIKDRFVNYYQTIEVWKKSPIFGVGYNNICIARQKYNFVSSTQSHSCYGADSSILFLLATTGIVGLMVIVKSFLSLLLFLIKTKSKEIPISIMTALLIHSQFGNSLFYPWVMLTVGVVMSVAVSARTEQ